MRKLSRKLGRCDILTDPKVGWAREWTFVEKAKDFFPGFIFPLALLLLGCQPAKIDRSAAKGMGNLYWNHNSSSAIADEPNFKQLFFERASLNKAREIMENQNLELKIQNLKIKQARTSEGLSRVASFPNLFFSLDASDAKSEGQNSNQSWSTSFSSSWELDLWGELASNKREAGIRVSGTEVQLEALELSLLYQFLNAQIRLAGAHQRLRLLDLQIEEQKEMEAQTLDLFQNGRGTETSVLLQRELRLSLESGVPLIQESRERATLDISQLLRVPVSQVEKEFSFDLPDKPNVAPEGNGSEWLDRRFDCRLAWLSVLESEEAWLQAKARRLPSLTLRAQFGFSGQHPGELFDQWLRQLSAGLLAPVFDAGQRQLEATLASDLVQQRLLELRNRAESSYGELEGLRLSWTAQYETWERKLLQLEASSRSLKSIKERYQMGESSLLDVLQQRSQMRSLEMQVLNYQLQTLELQVMWMNAQALPLISIEGHPNTNDEKPTSESET